MQGTKGYSYSNLWFLRNDSLNTMQKLSELIAQTSEDDTLFTHTHLDKPAEGTAELHANYRCLPVEHRFCFILSCT